MTRSILVRMVFVSVIALAAQTAATGAQEMARDEQVAAMAAQHAVTGFSSDLDYKVSELVQMQALAILEEFVGGELGDGAYRSDGFKLNEWMPHYQGQVAQLVAAVNREKLMDEADRERFIQEADRFSELVLAGEAIVRALNANDADTATEVFRTRSLPVAKEIRGGMYTLSSAAKRRFREASRGL